MRVIKISEVKKESFSAPIFTGSDVTRQVLLPDSKEYNVKVMNFGKGVRNKFHAHDSEQILVVTFGKGVIATETEEKVITVGDVVIIPAGGKHRQGDQRLEVLTHLCDSFGKHIDSIGGMK